MNIFISVPMNNRSDDEVWQDIRAAMDAIPKIFPKVELWMYHTLNTPGPKNAGRLYYLGTSVQALDVADAVYFCPGWKDAKGCLVEHYICELYGIQRIEA